MDPCCLHQIMTLPVKCQQQLRLTRPDQTMFFNLQLSRFGKPMPILASVMQSYLPGVAPDAAICSCRPPAQEPVLPGYLPFFFFFLLFFVNSRDSYPD